MPVISMISDTHKGGKMHSYLKKNGKSSILENIGITLVLIGVPLGMYFNFIFPFVEWSPVFMSLSILFIISYKNVARLKFPSWNLAYLYVFILQFLMVLYGLFSKNMTGQYFAFHMYIILLCISFASLNKNKTFESLFDYIFVVSSVTSVLGGYFLFKDLVVGDEVYNLKKDLGLAQWILDPFTVANGALINFTAILFLFARPKYSFKNLILVMFIVLDIYVFLASTKRTPVFVCIVITFTYFYKTGYFRTSKITRLLGILSLITVGLFVIYIEVLEVQVLIDRFAYNFYSGVLNLFGVSDVKDTTGSAIARFNSREWTYRYIENQFDFMNYIFGAGYMTKWIDNPILQSYLDMGIAGVILYSSLVILFPAYYLVSKVQNEKVLFVLLVTLYSILSALNSGNPYAYIKFTPICLLIFALTLAKKQPMTKKTLTDGQVY